MKGNRNSTYPQKMKLHVSDLRRLLSLAKAEKWKIAVRNQKFIGKLSEEAQKKLSQF